jgi:hypothetical protein
MAVDRATNELASRLALRPVDLQVNEDINGNDDEEGVWGPHLIWMARMSACFGVKIDDCPSSSPTMSVNSWVDPSVFQAI